MASGSPNLTEILDRFEVGWREDRPSNLATFLAAPENATPAANRLDLLQELIAIDLEHGWRSHGTGRASGKRDEPTTPDLSAGPRLEDYVARFPELEQNGSVPLALVLEEYRVRHRWGDRPAKEKYVRRFPVYRDRLLAALAAVDRELGPEHGDTIAHNNSESETGKQRGSTLRVRCPHCQNLVETPGDSSLSDLLCDACGSHFSLVDPNAETRTSAVHKSLGHFDLVERLGLGAFGEVWKARDRELDRTVAIKVPRKGALNAAETEKFLREARAAAQLKHANIVGIHEVGREGETVYIVSDLVRGLTLSDWLTGQRPTVRRAAELCRTIAGALHHAHEAGVVHRDLKPANIMIDDDGEPHVMDFGMARRDVGDVTMTIEGQVLGTPSYMSPEQAQGEAHSADRRTDVYSLGVILYEFLTGELPFRWNLRMIIHQVINDEPSSPRKLNNHIPRDLETICLKCLEKSPDKRYATAQEAADELGRFLRGEPVRARPITRLARGGRWTRRNPMVASLLGLAAALLVGIAAVSAGAYFKTSQALEIAKDSRRAALTEAKRARAENERANKEKLRAEAALAAEEGQRRKTQAALKAEEQQLIRTQTLLADMYATHGQTSAERGNVQEALSWFATAAVAAKHNPDREWANRLRFRNWLPEIPVPVHAAHIRLGEVDDIEVHPSNQHILVRSAAGIVLWDLKSGATTEHPHCRAIWSDDGALLARSSADGWVEVLEFPGQTLRQRFQVNGGTAPHIAFSPDGQWLAVGAKDVRVWCLASNAFLAGAIPFPVQIRSLQFAENGKCLVTSCDDGFGRVYEVSAAGASSRTAFPPVRHSLIRGVGIRFVPPLIVKENHALFTLTPSRLALVELRTGDQVGHTTSDRAAF